MPTEKNGSKESNLFNSIRFSHRLRLWPAISRGLGVIVAVMFFVLLDDATGAAGSSTPLFFLLTTLLMMVNGLAYAELAGRARRPGGAYTLVNDGPAGLAFVTGWALALSGLGLCGLLARGSAHYLNALLVEFFDLSAPIPFLAMGWIALVVLISILTGWENRRFTFTLPMVLVVMILAAASISHLQTDRSVVELQRPGEAIAILFAAFIGLEITAGRQADIRHRPVNFPRAWLITPVLAAILGAVVAAVAIGVAGPTEIATSETAVALLGHAFGGIIGQGVVWGAGTVFLALSLSRTIPLVIRHFYVMSQDGFLPARLRQVHPRWQRPIRLILLAGLLTLPIVWMPTALLSQVSGLLYLFTLMSVNLTVARRPQPEPRPAFSLPFHPWVPSLVLAADLLVLPLWGWMPVVWLAGCLGVGGLIYLVYGRNRYIRAQEGVTIFRPPTRQPDERGFQVLVPIANPSTAGTLLRMAGRIARDQRGNVLALQVVVVPEPVPLETGRRRAQASQELLEGALVLADKHDLPIQTMTRVARSVAQGVLDTATEEEADLILLGWSGPTRSRGGSLGTIVDGILQNASCDVMVMRGEKDALPTKILVPTAGGPHARVATRLALGLGRSLSAQVTLLSVQRGPATPQQMEENQRKIAETLEGLTPQVSPEKKVIMASSVVEGIVQEAEEYDLVLLGVSEETLLDRIVFGSVPLQVAERVPAAALVQGYRGLTGIWGRRLVRALREAIPVLSHEEQLEVQQALIQGAQPGTNYFVLIVLSCMLATLGLLLNNPAVIIGSMLVAPLWSPILAFSLGLVLGDLRLIRFSTEAIFKGIALAILIAAAIGLFSPLRTMTEEMLARGQPTLLDMAVALVSGIAGSYAFARKDVSAALPGVAIAAALMPPLATIGLGLSLGDGQVVIGAILLFVTNIAAISLAGGIVFVLLGIRPRAWDPESRRKLRRRLVGSLLLLLTIAVPLGIIMGATVRDATQEQEAHRILVQQLAARDSELMTLEIERGRTELLIVATVRSAEPLDQEMVNGLSERLGEQFDRPVRLEVVLLPVLRSE